MNMIVNAETAAPLENVKIFNEMVHKLRNRNPRIQGFALFYGPSGFGKTEAAEAACRRHALPMISCDPGISRKGLFKDICKQFFISCPAHATTEVLKYLIIEELQSQKHPLLIIDEADFLFEKGLHEDIRALQNVARQFSVIFIGEEDLLIVANRFERFDGRILLRTPAQPCSPEDAALLRPLICADIEISDELFEAVLLQSAGSARRVVENLNKINEAAGDSDTPVIGLKDFLSLRPEGLSSRAIPKMRPF